MKNHQAVALQWVIVGGKLKHVSDFSHLSPSQRPTSLCPICGDPVTMKLGEVRIHHVAHQPDSVCLATQPETALHLNTKIYIAEQLRKADKLLIRSRCSSHYSCNAFRDIPFASDWSTVQLEVICGSRKPDISLFRGEDLILAIEILVTHAVDEEKATYYKQHDIPWLEIKADENIYSGPTSWTVDQPIPFFTIYPRQETWICKECQQRAERDRLEEQNRYRAQTIFGIIVDLFYPSGKKYRECYWIKEISKGGNPQFYSLQNEKRKTIAKHNAPLTNEALEYLKEACRNDVRTRSQRPGTKVDSPTGWVTWQPGNKFYPADFERNPLAYQWDEHKRQWIRIQPSQRIVLELPLNRNQEGIAFCRNCGVLIEKWGYFEKTTDSWFCPECARDL